VIGFVHAQDAYGTVDDVDLIETARILSNTPTGRKRQIEQLRQQDSIHAIMADHDDQFVGMAM
jgi:hypothetical protein